MGQNTVALGDDNFDEKVLKSTTPVLVDFWAPWCPPCVAIGPMLEDLAAEYKGKVAIGKMNVDENAHVPATYGVRSIPYLALFKDGKLVGSAVGAQPKAKLIELIQKAL